jgi:hypothetical protein
VQLCGASYAAPVKGIAGNETLCSGVGTGIWVSISVFFLFVFGVLIILGALVRIFSGHLGFADVVDEDLACGAGRVVALDHGVSEGYVEFIGVHGATVGVAAVLEVLGGNIL